MLSRTSAEQVAMTREHGMQELIVGLAHGLLLRSPRRRRDSQISL